MKLSFIWTLFIFYSLTNCAQSVAKPKGCAIEFLDKTFKNKTFYLASHYGKFQTLVDSVTADAEGRLLFKNNENLDYAPYGCVPYCYGNNSMHFTAYADKSRFENVKIAISAYHNDNQTGISNYFTIKIIFLRII